METQLREDGEGDYVLAADKTSSVEDLSDLMRYSLSTVRETTSVDSERQQKEHVNGRIYDNTDEKNGYSDEVEITDGGIIHSRSSYSHLAPTRKKYALSKSVENNLQCDRCVISNRHGSSVSDVSKLQRISKHERSHRRDDRLIYRQTEFPQYTFDYWTLPRTHELIRRNFNLGDNLYATPGCILFPKKTYKSHKHRHSKYDETDSSRDSRKKNSGRKLHLQDNSNSSHRSELKVYFRFSKGALSNETAGLDYYENEPYLIALQAYCRGWLTRQKYDRLREENEAVRIIQRNAERLFNPWVRLMLALRPLLKSNRIEEELLYLRSELERYKTLVKMLRYENAEYQSKVANLLQLIEQINSKGAGSEVVTNLVSQITDILARNQEFWQQMAVNNQALQAVTLQRPTRVTETDGSPLLAPSPLSQLRQDADFYRNQVEMLKEEADEQQHRSSEHFRGQVNVLGDRVEHLQHLLALESSKVERLSAELEDMTTTIAEAKTYERNLEHMVTQLSRQLEQKTKALEIPTPSETNKLEVNGSYKPEPETLDMEQQLVSYRTLLSQLRDYFVANPKAMAALADSPFQPGSELDIFKESTLAPQVLVNLERIQQYQAAKSPSPTKDDRSTFDDLTTRSGANDELVELKRQLVEADKMLSEKSEQIKSEVEDREVLESENNQLRNRISALERQLRDVQEDFDENCSRRDLMNQRQMKEMAEQLEEEARKVALLTQQNRDMERELTELRNLAEPEEEMLNDEWESMKSKLRADVSHYKRSMELLQEEFDQFRRQNDPQKTREELDEKEERINLLEREKQQWRLEMEVLQVKLQNATSLLEDTENRLKWATREKTAQVHRLQQLEGERDEAIREAATIAGRASAEKESTAAKVREFEELRIERDGLRRELTELKQTLAGCTAETTAEKRQLQARLRELEVHHEARISDLKAELERAREDMERLQVDLQTAQSSEVELKASSHRSRWKIDALEDQLSNAMRRVANLERRNTDLEAELVRAKADLTASREAATLKRASRSRMADEWVQGIRDDSNTEDEDKVYSPSSGLSRIDGGFDNYSESSTSPRLRRRAPNSLRPSSLCRSSSSIFRPLSSGEGRIHPTMDRFLETRASVHSLNKLDNSPSNLTKTHRSSCENPPVTYGKVNGDGGDLTPVADGKATAFKVLTTRAGAREQQSKRAPNQTEDSDC
ncbi:hypothetical protein CSKR_105509 [Clonorchis sinensis]|uniref:Uncharacterized protein n=1 Tax=Clonorchis sinensis TaxID=79923 RepID=A0A3R7BZU5_CLOSI|nr:hypothetical protein CSKR_105509 [Clonorchis sinensis]